MDSFGTWRKWKLIYIFNAQFYRVVWTINALLTVRSEMLPLSGNNQNKNVRSPPEHFAIGYVHNDNLPLGNIALQYRPKIFLFWALFTDLEQNIWFLA